MNGSAPSLSLDALADLVADRLASRMPVAGLGRSGDGLPVLPWQPPLQGADLRDPRLSGATLGVAGVEFTQSIQHHGAVGTCWQCRAGRAARHMRARRGRAAADPLVVESRRGTRCRLRVDGTLERRPPRTDGHRAGRHGGHAERARHHNRRGVAAAPRELTREDARAFRGNANKARRARPMYVCSKRLAVERRRWRGWTLAALRASLGSGSEAWRRHWLQPSLIAARSAVSLSVLVVATPVNSRSQLTGWSLLSSVLSGRDVAASTASRPMRT